MSTKTLLSDKLPLLLKEIANPPKKIYVAGTLDNESLRIGIVGTRKATSEGRAVAEKIAMELSAAGIIVVSGLAMGIDTAAHEGVIRVKGKTIAVLPTGLDQIYPRQNESLAKKIIENDGALVSEYPENTASYPHHFIERNRIISGLSLGVIIIEAPERSGALSTARFALEQNREVFVVPGPANHPNYIGAHRLIRDGARLVTSAKDVLEDLGLPNEKILAVNKNTALSADETLIVKLIEASQKPITIDSIIEETKKPVALIQATINILVSKLIVKETLDGRYHL